MERDKLRNAGMYAMALFRAIEASRPQNERLFSDEISRALLPFPWWIFTLPGFRETFVVMAEKRGPGALGNLFCRTRYIDETLNDALTRGLIQVVILGAGFDCRAYRISGIGQMHVFEVDLPTTQRLKKVRLQKVMWALQAHVTYVPVDFNQQDLEVAMNRSGFRKKFRTFYIWEGVTQYITNEAVEDVLRWVSQADGAGSRIVFTYIRKSLIDGSDRSLSDQKIFDLARNGGSPWIYGLDPAEIGSFLSRRDFKLLEDVGYEYYSSRYLNPIGRMMEIFDGERVVLAQVGDVPRLGNKELIS